MTDAPSDPSAGRQANGRFGPGNPGRPKGARNRVSYKVVVEILAEFEAGKKALFDRLYARMAAEGVRRLRRLRIRRSHRAAVDLRRPAGPTANTEIPPRARRFTAPDAVHGTHAAANRRSTASTVFCGASAVSLMKTPRPGARPPLNMEFAPWKWRFFARDAAEASPPLNMEIHHADGRFIAPAGRAEGSRR